MNNLDAVWAGLSTADRIVLLGHDRVLLTDEDKIRLAAVAAAKAERTLTATKRAPRRGSRRTRVPARR